MQLHRTLFKRSCVLLLRHCIRHRDQFSLYWLATAHAVTTKLYIIFFHLVSATPHPPPSLPSRILCPSYSNVLPLRPRLLGCRNRGRWFPAVGIMHTMGWCFGMYVPSLFVDFFFGFSPHLIHFCPNTRTPPLASLVLRYFCPAATYECISRYRPTRPRYHSRLHFIYQSTPFHFLTIRSAVCCCLLLNMPTPTPNQPSMPCSSYYRPVQSIGGKYWDRWRRCSPRTRKEGSDRDA